MIQIARIEDAKKVATVEICSCQSAYQGLMPDSLLSSLDVDSRTSVWKENILDNAQTTKLYLESGEVIGFCNFSMAKVSGASKNEGEIRALFLLKEYWAKGIGLKLALNSIEDLKNHGYSSVRVWVLDINARAIQFYQKLGFKCVGESKNGVHSGFITNELLMVKDDL